MKFEITRDQEFIKYCLTHPYVWKTRGDDLLNADPSLFFPIMKDVVYAKAGEFGLLIGIKFIEKELDVHVALLPQARGISFDICIQAIKWIFKTMEEINSLTALIPSTNALATRLAEKVGMKFVCNKEKSFLKNGVYVDQYLYKINREDIKC